jgi:hypothetical protein
LEAKLIPFGIKAHTLAVIAVEKYSRFPNDHPTRLSLECPATQQNVSTFWDLTKYCRKSGKPELRKLAAITTLNSLPPADIECPQMDRPTDERSVRDAEL